jgi:hypothetical protein
MLDHRSGTFIRHVHFVSNDCAANHFPLEDLRTEFSLYVTSGM